MSTCPASRAFRRATACLLCWATACLAETPDAPLAARSPASTVLLPVLAYSPDTDLMLGGTVLRFFYLEDDGPGVRPSVFVPVLIYTTKRQTMAFLNLDLNTHGGRDRLNLGGSYLRFPDKFYGIGRDSDEDAEEDYTPETFACEGLVERRVVSALRVGAGWRWSVHRLDELEPDGQLALGGLRGTERTRESAPLFGVNWDTRDNTWSPRRGSYLQSRILLAREALGGDHDYTAYAVDLRGYRDLGGASGLAAQLAATWLEGAPPFFALPRLGGQDGLRGYAGGRYLDAARALARLEWRRERLWGRLGLALFAGLGDVAPRLGALTTAKGLWTAGGGLRFALNARERVNLRLDLGAGRGSSGFYLTLGEAF